MKFVFLSNYFNHHQKPFSDCMQKLTEDNYYFIATEEITQERKDMGWGREEQPSYVKSLIKNEEERDFCYKTIDEADVVIFGNAPEYLIKERIKKGKLTFRYTERILKKKPSLYKDVLKKVLFPLRYNKKNYYLLCASAYTALDYAHYSCYKGKAYKWGYFPQVKQYDDVQDLLKSKKQKSLLWVSRFIDWKHPELPIKIAKRLRDEQIEFELNLIGTGGLKEEIARQIKENGLENCVHLLGTMSPEEVRAHMEASEIFLFTSDRNEGWGAVLGEAMNSACAVVTSHAIGATPFLVEDNKNGLIYQDGNFEDLYKKVKSLLLREISAGELGIKAYQTMTEIWNAETASKRIVRLSNALLQSGVCDEFDVGPCSKAEVIKDDWYR